MNGNLIVGIVESGLDHKMNWEELVVQDADGRICLHLSSPSLVTRYFIFFVTWLGTNLLGNSAFSQ